MLFYDDYSSNSTFSKFFEVKADIFAPPQA